jgi:hypothetical protein
VIGGAAKVTRIETGEDPEDLAPVTDGKDPTARAMDRKGGVARAKVLTPEKRQEIARKGAAKRWGKA